MKRKLIISLLGVMLAAASGMVDARDRISFGVFIGAPGYAYVAPPPVYYEPPPVYYVPPPRVHYAPPVVYYEPAPWGWRGHDKHHRGWRKRHWD